MNKPESNNAAENSTEPVERISKLYSQLADILDFLRFKENDLRKQKSEHIGEIMSKDIEKFIVPIFKVLQFELNKLDSTEPKKAIVYYKQIKDYLDYFCRYYPVLFSFWIFDPETRGPSIQTTEENITKRAIAVIVDEPGDEPDPKQREKANMFCDLCKMPMALAKACAIVSKGKPDLENSLLYLWFINKPAESSVNIHNDEASKYFYNAYEHPDLALSALRDVEKIIDHEYTEEKLIIELTGIGMNKVQMDKIIKIVRKKGETFGVHKGIRFTRPKWVLIRGVIMKCKRKSEEKQQFMQNRLLPGGSGQKLQTAKVQDMNPEELEKATNKAVNLLQHTENNLTRIWKEYTESKKKLDNGSASIEDIYNVDLLPQFIALDLKEYEEALRSCMRYRADVALKSFKEKEEVVECFYREYQDIEPAWTLTIEELQSDINKEKNNDIVVQKVEISLKKKKEDYLLKLSITKYKKEIDKARLTSEQKEKMLALVDQIESAKKAAREVEPDSPLPTKIAILEALSKLNRKTIEIIANEIDKPGIVIIPYRVHDKKKAEYLSVGDIIESLNLEALRHHEGQKKVDITGTGALDIDKIFTRISVSIVEMVPTLQDQLVATREEIKEIRLNFKKKGLHLCTIPEYLLASHQQIIHGNEEHYLDGPIKGTLKTTSSLCPTATNIYARSKISKKDDLDINIYFENGYVTHYYPILVLVVARKIGFRQAYTLIEWK